MSIVVDEELAAAALGLQSEFGATRPETHPIEEALRVLQTRNVPLTAIDDHPPVVLADFSVVVTFLMGSAQDNTLSA